MSKPGLFLTFEGIEGCGKSTQIRLIAEWLGRQGLPYVLTREPGGTELGKEIRRILLSEKTVGLTPLSEALLYLADRFHHICTIIRPALEAGSIVLCDRFHDSTVAYQGYARNIPMPLLDAVWRGSGISRDPDLTLLLDVQPEIGIRRSLQKLQAENLDESRFEKEALEFHARVRHGFLELARANPVRIAVLDGTGSVDAIHREVVQILQRRLSEEKLQ